MAINSDEEIQNRVDELMKNEQFVAYFEEKWPALKQHLLDAYEAAKDYDKWQSENKDSRPVQDSRISWK